MTLNRLGNSIPLAQVLALACFTLFSLATLATAETRSECLDRVNNDKSGGPFNQCVPLPNELTDMDCINAARLQFRAMKAACESLSDEAPQPPQQANEEGCISGDAYRRKTTCYVELSSSCRKRQICQVDVQTYGTDGKLYSNTSTLRVSAGGSRKYGATGTACGEVTWQCRSAK